MSDQVICVNCGKLTSMESHLVELESGEGGLVCGVCHPIVMKAGYLVDKSRLSKLPKWAQRQIRRLTRDLDSAREQLRQITTGDSPIVWNDSPVRDDWHGIPARATLRFTLDTGMLELQLREGVLQIRNYSHGRIMVQPNFRNSLEISVQPREAADAAVLMQMLREMEVEDRYQDMEDSGIEKCFRCNVPVGDGHALGCTYYPLPSLQS